MLDWILYHVPGTKKFVIINRLDGTVLGTVEPPDPKSFRSADSTEPVNLIEEFSWYANSFLHEEEPDIPRADRFLRFLQEWGEATWTICRREEVA